MKCPNCKQPFDTTDTLTDDLWVQVDYSDSEVPPDFPTRYGKTIPPWDGKKCAIMHDNPQLLGVYFNHKLDQDRADDPLSVPYLMNNINRDIEEREIDWGLILRQVQRSWPKGET